MKLMRSLGFGVLVAILGGLSAMAEDANWAVPSAVTSDPRPDPRFPPHSAQVLVPSHGVGMNGLFYLAGGAGPHPTLILLHGFPGNEQNLDLAQAVRRAGWNVLTLHYRGSWGSPGNFSFAHVLEDADAAVAFVRDPATVTRFGIDPGRLVIAGHSMGGFAAAGHARHDTMLAGLVLIDPWNVGATGAKFAAVTGSGRAALVAKEFDDLGNSLHGASGMTLATEIVARGEAWNIDRWAGDLTHGPVLVIGASRGLGEESRHFSDAIRASGGNVTSLTLDSDHSFQDNRIRLAAEVVRFLDSLSRS